MAFQLRIGVTLANLCFLIAKARKIENAKEGRIVIAKAVCVG